MGERPGFTAQANGPSDRAGLSDGKDLRRNSRVKGQEVDGGLA